MRFSIPTLLVAFLAIAILLVYAFTYRVNFHQVAVEVRFGQADESSVVREPGLKFRWPPPITRVEHYDTRLMTLDTPETEIKTVDGKNVIMGIYAVWRISDPLEFHRRVRKVELARPQMQSRLSAAQSAVIGRKRLADFVNLDAELKEKNYQQMLDEILNEAKADMRSQFGVSLESIGVRRISLPPEATMQVFEAMRQERERLAGELKQAGKSRAEGIKARARQQADQIMAFVERRAQEIESEGVRAATRIYEQIPAGDREFFVWLRWLDALEASLSQKTTIILDQASPLFEPFLKPPGTAAVAP